MLKSVNLVGTSDNKLKLGSYNGAQCTKDNGITFMLQSQVIIERGGFYLVHHGNI